MKLKKILLALPIMLVSLFSNAQALSNEESQLYALIMKYRKENGLPEIPLSAALTYVAQTHVKDLADNNPDTGRCNAHSWSANGDWTPCCYTPDHAQAKCMWNKPRELTDYKGNGYEIAYWNSDKAKAAEALASWKSSSAHHAVILNRDIWDDRWNAIGIGVYQQYAVVWFGKELDNK